MMISIVSWAASSQKEMIAEQQHRKPKGHPSLVLINPHFERCRVASQKTRRLGWLVLGASGDLRFLRQATPPPPRPVCNGSPTIPSLERRSAGEEALPLESCDAAMLVPLGSVQHLLRFSCFCGDILHVSGWERVVTELQASSISQRKQWHLDGWLDVRWVPATPLSGPSQP